MIKTYHGSCHCGAVRFEADLDLSKGTQRCNCTLCRKLRNWVALTTPDHFRLIAGAEGLGQFFPAPNQIPGQSSAYCFCATCGVRVFSRGDHPALGGAFVSVAIAALDDATAQEVIAAPITWCDGLNNDWAHAPAEVRHL
jgi:hypothetical protein